MADCGPDGCARPGPNGGMCRDCAHRRALERKRLRRTSDPGFRDREAAERRRHRERNGAALNAGVKAWKAANPERVRAEWAAWYAEHRTEVLDRLAKPEERARMNAWRNADRAANPEKYRERERRHRQSNAAFTLRNRENSRRRNSHTAYSRILYAEVLERDGMVCHLCGDPIAGLDDLHFDHVIPLALGGSHEAGNVKPAHAACNLRKSARLI